MRPPAPEPLPVPVVDTHCHLDMALDGDPTPVEAALAASAAVGVPRILQVGCEVDSARWSVEVAATHDDIVAAVALHPNEVACLAIQGRAMLDAAYDEIEALALHPRVRAVGETGLDYYRTGEDGWGVQEESFRWHIALAKQLDKALVIHDRDAHHDIVRVLDSEGPPERVVFHCFSGGPELARICADRGWYASFAGTVTFKNAQPLRDALRLVPAGLVLVETDAPYLAPTPYRGRPNASYLVPVTVRAMAETRGDDLGALCTAIGVNAETAFGRF
ncbi:MAG: TatD family hydrolase [Candidatus Nanopelagicales bacterium]